jgi:hypothetical protein
MILNLNGKIMKNASLSFSGDTLPGQCGWVVGFWSASVSF